MELTRVWWCGCPAATMPTLPCSLAREGQAAEPRSSWGAQSSTLQTGGHRTLRSGVTPRFAKLTAGALPHPGISGTAKWA